MERQTRGHLRHHADDGNAPRLGKVCISQLSDPYRRLLEMKKTLPPRAFELITKRTRKREFLDEMNLVIPRTELVALIEPHAPSGKTGRQPFAVVTVPRIYFLQQ